MVISLKSHYAQSRIPQNDVFHNWGLGCCDNGCKTLTSLPSLWKRSMSPLQRICERTATSPSWAYTKLYTWQTVPNKGPKFWTSHHHYMCSSILVLSLGTKRILIGGDNVSVGETLREEQGGQGVYQRIDERSLGSNGSNETQIIWLTLFAPFL